MPHISGKRVSKSHSTIIEEARAIMEKALNNELVDKVVVGNIVSIVHGPRRIKFQTIATGLKIMIRGINARQIFYVYTKNPKQVSLLLRHTWEKQKY